VHYLDAGLPITIFGGVHAGCFELFVHGSIHAISDLKGKRIGIQTLSSSGHFYTAIMAANVGLDPAMDTEWVEDANALGLFENESVDAFLAFPPEPQRLRARNVGRVIVRTATDRPWSDYFCCMAFTSRDFAMRYPVATKRALRALLKAADFCAADPAAAARRLVDAQFTDNYEYAFDALRDVPYRAWRDLDGEDSLRFYALSMHEAGMVKSSPREIIANGTDWRFLNELKRELKA
jgi:NitT/TauT family transport system substrate-binding protein